MQGKSKLFWRPNVSQRARHVTVCVTVLFEKEGTEPSVFRPICFLVLTFLKAFWVDQRTFLNSTNIFVFAQTGKNHLCDSCACEQSTKLDEAERYSRESILQCQNANAGGG